MCILQGVQRLDKVGNRGKDYRVCIEALQSGSARGASNRCVLIGAGHVSNADLDRRGWRVDRVVDMVADRVTTFTCGKVNTQ